MPFGSVKLIPGVNTSRTPTLLESGYSSSGLIRWQDGLAQIIGGWTKYYSSTVTGTPRALHAWQDLNGEDYLAVGTTSRLYYINDSTLTDITPGKQTNNITPNFTVPAPGTGSVVTVVDASLPRQLTQYDSVFFDTPITVGGGLLSGLYPVTGISATSYSIDISPNTFQFAVANAGSVPTFTTTIGSPLVTVGWSFHNLYAGDKITFPVATTVGGLTISGTYIVFDRAGGDLSFRITADAPATSSAGPTSMNSGQARLTYYLCAQPGGTTYGTALTSTDWTFANWGEIILGCSENGGIYSWRSQSGFPQAQLIENGPLYNSGICIAMPAQILMAYGSTIPQFLQNHPADQTVPDTVGYQQDPLLIRWSDQEDYTVWDDEVTNQAGSFRIPSGSRIVAGLQTQQQMLFWTDIDLWSCTYINQPLIFSFQKIGSSCGLVAKHAVVSFRDRVYWMGQSNFFTGTGAVLPCTVWDNVFQDLNTAYLDRCWAWGSTPFNEIWFFYPSASGSATECDKYVKYNVVSGVWDYGDLPRTCGIDQSLLGNPIAAASTGYVYQHESGYSADGSALTSSFQTGFFKIAEGEDYVFVDKFYPDMRFGFINASANAVLSVTFYVKNYSSSSFQTFGPYSFTSSTEEIDVRFHADLVAVNIQSSVTDAFWRIGAPRFRFQTDGRR